MTDANEHQEAVSPGGRPGVHPDISDVSNTQPVPLVTCEETTCQIRRISSIRIKQMNNLIL